VYQRRNLQQSDQAPSALHTPPPGTHDHTRGTAGSCWSRGPGRLALALALALVPEWSWSWSWSWSLVLVLGRTAYVRLFRQQGAAGKKLGGKKPLYVRTLFGLEFELA
jgi:hypothetical protein